MHDAYRHVVVFFFYRDGDHRDLHSFPTRRSSDLEALEQRFLRQSGFRLSLSRFHDLYDEGLIGKEVFEDLEREQTGTPPLLTPVPLHALMPPSAYHHPPSTLFSSFHPAASLPLSP